MVNAQKNDTVLMHTRYLVTVEDGFGHVVSNLPVRFTSLKAAQERKIQLESLEENKEHRWVKVYLEVG